MAQYKAAAGQSVGDSTCASRIHNASQGETKAQHTSEIEKRIVKEPRDAGVRMRIRKSAFPGRGLQPRINSDQPTRLIHSNFSTKLPFVHGISAYKRQLKDIRPLLSARLKSNTAACLPIGKDTWPARRMSMGMPRPLFCSVLVAMAFHVSGCGTPGNQGAATQDDVEATAVAATATPRFQGGEKIKITVYNEPSLSGDYDIDPNGVVSLPLAGTVRATGLTQAQLEQELAKKFKSQYLKNPKVTVTILQFRPIYLVGEVEKQGEYPYKPGLNSLTAMALAGGGTYRANRNYILIQHFGESGMKEYPQSATTLILPGDLIKVPERYF